MHDKKNNEYSRPPNLEDLVKICDGLNKSGAAYIVIGGMAMVQLGFIRATEDIDFLIDKSVENEKLVLDVLARLPDHAARQIAPGEIQKYEIIRARQSPHGSCVSETSYKKHFRHI